jgi:hypothetical protein
MNSSLPADIFTSSMTGKNDAVSAVVHVIFDSLADAGSRAQGYFNGFH